MFVCFSHSIHLLHLSLLVAMMVIPAALPAQSIVLYDADPFAYPLMRAKFYAFDADGSTLLQLQPGDFTLTENGEERQVLDIRCPTLTPAQPLSAVLTIDVSGSMDGPRLALAQSAAHAWIDAFPAAGSECALTSFTTTNLLHQDFTNDKPALRAAVNSLQAGGGTHFDAAFIDPFAGALRIAARGKFKKVIVVLTDGRATGSPEIISVAKQTGAQVFCISIDENLPEILRRVCDETGGRSFTGVTTAEEARRIYRSILRMSQEIAPCVIEWESGGCSYFRLVEARLDMYGAAAQTSYSISKALLPDIQFLPSPVLAFGEVSPGSSTSLGITLKAAGSRFRIDSILVEDARFVITDLGGSPPPFHLGAGEERTITLRYDALDSSYVTTRIRLVTTACSDAFFATAGYRGKGEDRRVITLLHPNGGEVFVAGSDTVITWEGITPQEAVRLDFSADAGASWELIADNVSGLRYAWRVPVVASDHCLVRVTTRETLPVPDDMVLVPPGVYRRGDLNGTGTAAEHPAHEVRLTHAFLMSATEITQRAFEDVMGYNPAQGTQGDQHPVTGVSWYDAIEYCNSRSRLEGLDECYTISGDSVHLDAARTGYRLPTEAEWEYACRAGSNDEFAAGEMSEPYCDPLDPVLSELGWYCGNSGGAERQAAQRSANAFGIHDMHGNVLEWCWDYFNVYHPGTLIDPEGPGVPGTSQYRVIRGGMYSSFAGACRNSARDGAHARVQGVIGFRVVRTYR